jgi:hypothetical protein
MSEHKDERWLDEQLRRAVDGTTPVFDADAWKQRYAGEFQALLHRGEQPDRSGTSRTLRLVSRSSMGKLAMAAVVIATAGILLVGRFEPGPGRPSARPPSVELQSSARMVSMMSLAMAYRRGGEDALNQQLDAALNKLGPRPNGFSALLVLRDLEG